ncbi:hypothetical protein MTR_8g073555 [Medicago truncatula]|uniref:Uncharacterized protein n=1 Tax=Medicago truncatula TaxID=3880 RepID=A0A072TU89_MEDTR|nr:hypothetical protein MTR_8g073555 [Medicago truncatula]
MKKVQCGKNKSHVSSAIAKFNPSLFPMVYLSGTIELKERSDRQRKPTTTVNKEKDLDAEEHLARRRPLETTRE